MTFGKPVQLGMWKSMNNLVPGGSSDLITLPVTAPLEEEDRKKKENGQADSQEESHCRKLHLPSRIERTIGSMYMM
jgi:hypothetical protein